MSEINDFPKLNETKIVENLFYGNYYIKQSKSYLPDLIKNNKCSILTEKDSLKLDANEHFLFSRKLQKSKILGMEITSRHKHSLRDAGEKLVKMSYIKKYRINYKFFIQYVPNVNQKKGIPIRFFLIL